MTIAKLYAEREALYRADPAIRDYAWEQVQSEALPPRLCAAMLANDWNEAGRIVTGLFLANIRARAEESVDSEQEAAEAMDLALHAEMMGGLMPEGVRA